MSLEMQELEEKPLSQIIKEAYFRELTTPTSELPLWERVAQDARDWAWYWSCGCL